MLATADKVPYLEVIPNMPNVIKEISLQSLQVALLIDEYTKLGRAGNSVSLLPGSVDLTVWLNVGRTIRIQVDLKPRIEKCSADCAILKAKLHNAISLDTNIRLKKMENARQGKLDLCMLRQ